MQLPVVSPLIHLGREIKNLILGNSIVLSLSLTIARLEAEVAELKHTVKTQSTQIESLLKVDAAAQTKIAVLKAKLVTAATAPSLHLAAVDDGASLEIAALEAAHKAQRQALQHAAAARDLAHTHTVDSHAAEITALTSQVDNPKAGVLLRYQEVKDAHAARDRGTAGTLASQAALLAGLRSAVGDLKAPALAATAASDADAKRVRRAKRGAIKRRATVEKTAAEARGKGARSGELEARVEQLGSEALDVAAKTIVNGLRVTERLQGLEERAIDVEGRAENILRDSKASVKALAIHHAKDLAAAHDRPAPPADIDAAMADAPEVVNATNPDVPLYTYPPIAAAHVPPAIAAPKSTADFSFGCEYYFSTRFAVRADSSLAQASIAAPARFVKSARQIVQRGGDSALTPLLLPAWPGEKKKTNDDMKMMLCERRDDEKIRKSTTPTRYRTTRTSTIRSTPRRGSEEEKTQSA
ncbi:hypothetical protein B0H17DRAFT_1197952 [Mycena rosella]|uniref:Uncharacterized protein n=1 Tax=Mycena rosella TaxID=1033263 RepID=A0AAD7GMR4_MYCRO|nr:hypothetical protein B0H17DRAFT_1197952 [Mycena rosella]